MKEVIKKIAQAKELVKGTKMKKEGKNTFSGYDYFTPTQIEKLVSEVCEKCGIMTMFELIRNEFGVYGELTVYDLESSESLKVRMATAIPEIKATNIAQQLGGCVTYTERYLKTSVFGIIDNNLDFDNQKQPTDTTPPKRDEGMINACSEAKKSTTEALLKAVWEKYPQYQKDNTFITAVNMRKAELTKK